MRSSGVTGVQTCALPISPDAAADLVDDLRRSVLGQSASVGQPGVLGIEIDVGADGRGGGDGGRGAVGHGAHPRSWVGMTWMTSRYGCAAPPTSSAPSSRRVSPKSISG